MLKNYIKVALRNILKTKTHSFITVTGLAVGIACCILIVLFVKDEWTFDTFHKKSDRIYRAWVFEDYGEDEQFFNTTTPYPLGPALEDNFSEVAGFVRYNQIGQPVKVGVDTYNETVSVVGPHFFDIFDFDAVYGKLNHVLDEKSNMVLTRSAAQKFFGVDNAVGQTVEMDFGDGPRTFTVKAIVDNPPTNSSLQFNILISDLNNDVLVNERVLQSWFNVSAETYVVLNPGVEAESLEAKFPALSKQIMGEDYEEGVYNIGLQPLTDIHLNTEMPTGIAPVSDPQYAYILTAVAFLILLLGGINFVTLSISRSVNRGKEVGVRKVVGAQRRQLIAQFLSETLITSLIAVGIGLLLAYALLPMFNELAGRALILEFNAFLLLVLAGLVLVIGIMAGSYPALLLSGFRPIAVLKGKISPGSSRQNLRKGLVGFQFVLTVFLISTTLLMKEQLNYLQSKNLGFDQSQVLVAQLNVQNGEGLLDRISKGMEKGALFKNELRGAPQIEAVALANHTFGTGGWTNVGYTDTDDNYRTFDVLAVDEDYIPAMKMEMAAGRNFDAEKVADKRRSIIVNEAFVDDYGWADAVGKKIPGANFEDHEIIGVVKDFNYNSLHGEITPLVLVLNPMVIAKGIENIGIGSNPLPKLMVRVDGNQVASAIQLVSATWDKIDPENEFQYTFVDQTLAAQYSQEQNLGKVITIASILAIIIGCMGLFALSALNMANRTKEISIRKVLGASRNGLLIMLSKEYVLLMLMALIVSVPITIYFINGWLADFAYRISIGVDTFILTGVILAFIGLGTIAFHTVKTANQQPADTLKYE
ncbi:MAG: ABC transporter permease [Fulvivirga sp.]|nr:ABC transporter permease [Fulvivirga sp.]